MPKLNFFRLPCKSKRIQKDPGRENDCFSLFGQGREDHKWPIDDGFINTQLQPGVNERAASKYSKIEMRPASRRVQREVSYRNGCGM